MAALAQEITPPQENMRIIKRPIVKSYTAGDIKVVPWYNTQLQTQGEITDTKFVNYYSKLNKEIEKHQDIISGFDLDALKSKAKSVISSLLYLEPDAFSLEIAGDDGIFYILKKNNITIYMSQWFEDDPDDGYCATLDAWVKGEKLPSCDGRIQDVLDCAYKIVQFS